MTSESIFFFIRINVAGTEIGGVFDTGSSDFVCEKEMLVNREIFMYTYLGEKPVQVVGGNTTFEGAYKILFPIIHPEFKYQVTHCLGVDQIISPLPVTDHSALMNQAYSAYADHCKTQGTPVPYTRAQWPTGQYGGTVSILIGIKNIEFSVIFSWCGLTVGRSV